ncbi:MAG: hypothetical protein QMC67_12700 [Candidatus Wallbacteria bacterium]
MNVNSMNRVSNNGMEFALAEVRKITETLMESDIPNDIIGRIIDPIIDDIKNERPLSSDIYCIVFEKMISMIGGAAINSMIPAETDNEICKPKVIIFIGPSGAGKTATMMKIGVNIKLNMKKNIVLVNNNTYNIGSHETIKCVGDIMGMKTIMSYNLTGLKKTIEDNNSVDYFLVDTAGICPNVHAIKELEIIMSKTKDISPELILVIPASIKTNIALKYIKNFDSIKVNGIIFTRTDESESLGTVFSVAATSNIPIMNLCNGSNVPDDIIPFNSAELIKNILNSHKNNIVKEIKIMRAV